MPTSITFKAVQFLIIEENAIHKLQQNGDTWVASWRAIVNGQSHSFTVDITIDQTGDVPEAVTALVVDGIQRSLPRQVLAFDEPTKNYFSQFQVILPSDVGVVHIEIAAVPPDGTILTIVPPPVPLEFLPTIDCETKNILATFTFKPTISTFGLLEFQLVKKKSTWVGVGLADFDLGSGHSCGEHLSYGVQSVKTKLNLSCGQSGGQMNVTGLLVIIAAKTFIKIPLLATGQSCPDGSAVCGVQWPFLYLGPIFGSGSLFLRGIKT